MYHKLLLLIVVLTALLPSTLLAQGIPNSPNKLINKAYEYNSILVDGDVLYLAAYDLQYTSTPSQPATNTWQGILIDDDTTTIIHNQIRMYSDVNPWNGYGVGVFGIYQSPKPTFGGVAKLCLDPVNVTGGERRCSSSFTTSSDITDLNSDLIEIFENLETAWRNESATATSPAGDANIDLIESLSDITKVLTLEGEDYAVNMIPKIREILPEFFSTSSITPTLMEESFDTTTTDTSEDFFDGTALDLGDPNSSLRGISTYTKIPVSILGLAIVLGVAAAIASAIIGATGRSEVGMMAGVMCISVGTYVGLVDFALAAIFAMLGALALGYIFFYKSSTS